MQYWFRTEFDQEEPFFECRDIPSPSREGAWSLTKDFIKANGALIATASFFQSTLTISVATLATLANPWVLKHIWDMHKVTSSNHHTLHFKDDLIILRRGATEPIHIREKRANIQEACVVIRHSRPNENGVSESRLVLDGGRFVHENFGDFLPKEEYHEIAKTLNDIIGTYRANLEQRKKMQSSPTQEP